MAGLNNFGGKKAPAFTKGGSRAERVARAKKGLERLKKRKAATDLANAVVGTIIDLDWAKWDAAHRGQRQQYANQDQKANGRIKGSAAERAIKRFQKVHGLPVTGKLDAATKARSAKISSKNKGDTSHALAKAVNAVSNAQYGKHWKKNERNAARDLEVHDVRHAARQAAKKKPTKDMSNTYDLATLSTKARKALSPSDFVFPSKRAYPIHDKSHAENALARSKGKPEHAAVVAAVKRKFPDLPAFKK
jgi:hypothetical protein